jgi:hypothetical protein
MTSSSFVSFISVVIKLGVVCNVVVRLRGKEREKGKEEDVLRRKFHIKSDNKNRVSLIGK